LSYFFLISSQHHSHQTQDQSQKEALAYFINAFPASSETSDPTSLPSEAYDTLRCVFYFLLLVVKFFVFRFAFKIPYSPSHFSSRIIDGLNNPHQQGGSNTSSASAANGGEEEVDVTDDAETNTDPLQVGRTSTSSACNSESETNQLSAHLNK
jgi:hypothetical protein